LSTFSALGFDSAETGAQVAVHQGALEAGVVKKFFQVIEENGLVRPGELIFSKQEALQDSAAPSEGLPTDHDCIRSRPRS
jgi:hypothetical protein